MSHGYKELEGLLDDWDLVLICQMRKLAPMNEMNVTLRYCLAIARAMGVGMLATPKSVTAV